MEQSVFRDPRYLERRIDVERRDDGCVVLRNPHPLRPRAVNIIEPLRKWALERPDQPWLCRRAPSVNGTGADSIQSGDWIKLTYAQAYARVNAIAQALLARGFTQATPLMILSGNTLEHALMTYGAILAGVPVAPVSPSYSLISSDFAKLKYVFDLIRPRMLFVQEGAAFAKALAALSLEGVEVVSADGSTGTPCADLMATLPTPAVEKSYDNLGDDTVAKYLFTSGSTGMPKAVITTHKMMCVNAVMPASVQDRREDDPVPVLLSWLPWHHCFGGNAVLNNVLTSGGTLYMDGGRPVEGQFDETLRNLRDIAPTTYSSVPAAYGFLVPALEKDAGLAKNFFSRLRTLAYGGAALSQDLHDRLQAVAEKAVGERIVFSSGYGATETAPTIMNVHWPTRRMGLLGLPLPGVAIKLVPAGSKMEVRVKGDCITAGYYKNPEKTAEAFDEEGFYRLGDAARFVDDARPEEGLVFDGRVAEDFKLASGTWVSAGRLRVQAMAAADGLLQDALITGLDRDYIGLLGFPGLERCRAIAQDDQASLAELVCHPRVLAALAAGLVRHNTGNPGSSTRIRRALLMSEPASVDAGELTDKGYINQSVALTRRNALVEKLYREPPGNDVVMV